MNSGEATAGDGSLDDVAADVADVADELEIRDALARSRRAPALVLLGLAPLGYVAGVIAGGGDDGLDWGSPVGLGVALGLAVVAAASLALRR